MELQMKQRKTLLIAQSAAAIFAWILAVIDFPYDSIWDCLGEFLVLPVVMAGLLRYCVRVYQIASIKLGRKIYDEEGNCMTVARRGMGVVVGYLSISIPLGVIGLAQKVSVFMMNATITVLMFVAGYLFIMDIKYFRKDKQTVQLIEE